MTEDPNARSYSVASSSIQHAPGDAYHSRPSLGGRIDAAERLIAILMPLVSDADLLHAYQRTDGELGNPEADALLAEIERRGLDV